MNECIELLLLITILWGGSWAIGYTIYWLKH